MYYFFAVIDLKLDYVVLCGNSSVYIGILFLQPKMKKKRRGRRRRRGGGRNIEENVVLGRAPMYMQQAEEHSVWKNAARTDQQL